MFFKLPWAGIRVNINYECLLRLVYFDYNSSLTSNNKSMK